MYVGVSPPFPSIPSVAFLLFPGLGSSADRHELSKIASSSPRSGRPLVHTLPASERWARRLDVLAGCMHHCGE